MLSQMVSKQTSKTMQPQHKYHHQFSYILTAQVNYLGMTTQFSCKSFCLTVISTQLYSKFQYNDCRQGRNIHVIIDGSRNPKNKKRAVLHIRQGYLPDYINRPETLRGPKQRHNHTMQRTEKCFTTHEPCNQTFTLNTCQRNSAEPLCLIFSDKVLIAQRQDT